jgi:hypothetical protein
VTFSAQVAGRDRQPMGKNAAPAERNFPFVLNLAARRAAGIEPTAALREW